MEAPKTFTLLTACCNGEKFIKEWADSIVKQTYRPLNVVVVDDLSSDDSFIKLRKMRKFFARHDVGLSLVRHKRHRKMYYGGTLRYAFTSTIGQYFGMLDIDDALAAPDAIEHVMDIYYKNPDALYVYTQFMTCDKNMKEIKIGHSQCPPEGESILTMGLKNIHTYSHFRTFATRVDHIVNIFLKPGHYAVDQYMGLMLEQMGRGIFTDKVCYLYRSGVEGSISALAGGERREYWHKMLAQFKEKRGRWYHIKHNEKEITKKRTKRIKKA